VATAPNPCNDSLFGRVLSGNAIVCSSTFKDYLTKSEQDAVQDVADRAQAQADAGYISQHSADVAQTAADQQSEQADADTENVTDAIAKSKVGQIFTTCDNGDSGLAIPGLPCVSWKWIGIGAAALVVLYVLALVSSFVPRPR